MSAPSLTFEDYLHAAVTTTLREHPEYRYGQALFNTLHVLRPDISERLRGSAVDPFYNSDLAGEFLLAVAGMWED